MPGSQAVVYVAKCEVNGKTYVGITSGPLKVRILRHHIKARNGSTLYFHRALSKYGSDKFTWSTYASGLTWAKACETEIYLIKNLGSSDPKKGYNMTKGGEGTLGMSVVLSQESRTKISCTLKSWHASGDSAAKELRAKVSAARQGSRASVETCRKHAEAMRGRVLSDSSREKISLSKQRYSAETREAVVSYALKHGYHAAERLFSIPRPTIRRWAKTPEEQALERGKTRERNRSRQYGYAFPFVPPREIDADLNQMHMAKSR